MSTYSCLLMRRDVTVPEIEFRNVNILGALQILPQIRMKSSELTVDFENKVFFVNLKSFVRQNPRVETTVFSIGTDVSEEQTANLLSAIEIGIEMIGDNSELLNMKLHGETGLLFAKGTPEQLQIIDNIINRLARYFHDSGQASRQQQSPQQQQQQVLQQLIQQMQEGQNRN